MQDLDLREGAGSSGKVARPGMTFQLTAQVGQGVGPDVPVIRAPRMRGPRQTRGLTGVQCLLDGLYQAARVG